MTGAIPRALHGLVGRLVPPSSQVLLPGSLEILLLCESSVACAVKPSEVLWKTASLNRCGEPYLAVERLLNPCTGVVIARSAVRDAPAFCAFLDAPATPCCGGAAFARDLIRRDDSISVSDSVPQRRDVLQLFHVTALGCHVPRAFRAVVSAVRKAQFRLLLLVRFHLAQQCVLSLVGFRRLNRDGQDEQDKVVLMLLHPIYPVHPC